MKEIVKEAFAVEPAALKKHYPAELHDFVLNPDKLQFLFSDIVAKIDAANTDCMKVAFTIQYTPSLWDRRVPAYNLGIDVLILDQYGVTKPMHYLVNSHGQTVGDVVEMPLPPGITPTGAWQRDFFVIADPLNARHERNERNNVAKITGKCR
jgi:hypothetical protein